jgi:hypothetical protein
MSQAAGRSDVEVELVPTAAAQPVTEVVAPAKQADDIPRGIAFMVGATVLFSVSSAFAKWQVATSALLGRLPPRAALYGKAAARCCNIMYRVAFFAPASVLTTGPAKLS